MIPSEDTDQHKAGDQEDERTPFQPQTQSLLRPRSATILSEQPEFLSSSSGTQESIYKHFENVNAVPISDIAISEPVEHSIPIPDITVTEPLEDVTSERPSEPKFEIDWPATPTVTPDIMMSEAPENASLERPSVIESDPLVPPTATPNQSVRPALLIRAEEPHLRFACPYYKRSPNEKPKQRSCVYPGFKTIARVKCNEIFGNDDAALHEHCAESLPCTVRESQRDYGDGFDQDQRSRLKKRVRKSDNKTDEEKWRDIYQTLFPKEEPVPTPYCSTEPFEGADVDISSCTGPASTPMRTASPTTPLCFENPMEQLSNQLRTHQSEDEHVFIHIPEFGELLPEFPAVADDTANDIWEFWDQGDKKMKKAKADPELEPEPVIVDPEPVERMEPYVSSPDLGQGSIEPLASDFPSVVEPTSDQLTLVDSTEAGTTLINTESDATTLESQLSFRTPGPSEQHHDTDHDYASVMSNDEDIASKGGNYRSREEVLAVKELGHFFAELEDLLPLHQELLEKLGPERFAENYRRVLKLYFLGLQREAKTIVEKQTALVLRKRFNRYTIAQKVANSMQTIGNDDSSQLDELSSQQVQKELGDWLAQLDNTAPQQSVDEQNESTYESNDEAEDGDYYEDIRIASVEQAKAFLRRGDPFRGLVLQLRLLALPLSIRDVLDMASMGSIAISSTNNNSLINRAKAFTEDYTGVEWDWWPLMPRVPDVGRNRFRLQWKVCGQFLYSEISPKDAESLRNILAVMAENTPECSDYGTNPKSLSLSSPSVSFFERIRYWVKQNLATSSFASAPSTAQQRYTPPVAAKASSGTPSNSSSGQNTAAMPPSSAVQSGGLSQTYGIDHNGTPGLQNNNARIIFGMRSKHGLDHIETIGTRDDLDDSTFFGELKRRHDAYRSFVHRLLSPFRFRYCNFVRFEYVFDDPLFSSEEGLPAWLNSANIYEHDPDYDYSPTPPRAKNPPIDSKLFSACLAACNTRCGWSSMSGTLHKCRFLSKTSQKWMRIPRKKTALTKDDHVMFGIEAEYALSFAMLFVYHAVFILAAFAFWIYWLKNHPDDLQNASVPIFTVLGLMGAFWGLLGRRLGAV